MSQVQISIPQKRTRSAGVPAVGCPNPGGMQSHGKEARQSSATRARALSGARVSSGSRGQHRGGKHPTLCVLKEYGCEPVRLTAALYFILYWTAAGKNSKQMAVMRDRTVKVIDAQRMALIRKFGARNMCEVCFRFGRSSVEFA